MQTEKVLIAGVSGFLGSHLANSLIASGLKVVGVDALVSGNKSNIEHLLGSPQFDFIETNINQRLPEAFFGEEWLAIVHVANTEILPSGSRIELNELLTNSFGVKNLLDLALRTKSKMIFTSTIDLYQGLASHTSLHHYYENSEQAGVLSYSEAKRFAEALCQEYVNIYGVDVRVVRLSETYGPRMNLESPTLTAKLIRKGLEGGVLALEDVGSRMLYVTYYSDVIFGLNKLVVKEDDKLSGGIFYLVNEEPVSVLSLVLAIKEYAPEEMTVEFLPRVEESLFDLPRINLTRSKNELYWSPKIGLQEGIKRTFEDFASKKPTPTPRASVEIPAVAKKKDPPPVADAGTAEEVEGEYIADIIDHAEKQLEQPEIETVPSAAQLKPATGWLSLKDKASNLPIKGLSLKTHRKSRAKDLLVIAAGAAFAWFVFVPLVGIFGHTAAAYYHMQQSQTALQQVDLVQSREHLRKAAGNITDLQYYLSRTQGAWSVLGQKELFTTIVQTSEAAKIATLAASWGVQFADTIHPWWQPLVQGEDDLALQEARTPERLEQAKLDWRLYRENIELSKSIFTKIREKNSWPATLVEGVTEAVEMVETHTRMPDESWVNLPEWLGYTTPQTIVVLLQNNHELRAGGGFIGSYALVTLDSGIIKSLLIDDIYNPDGQLDIKRTDTEPQVPEAIAKYMAVPELGLRDSNWDPHFPESGAAFIQLYETATGIRPNWVFGVNLLLIQDLLRVVEPLDLPITNTTITADNLFEKAEVASEVNFVPGSTGKKDFLTEATQQLWLALFPLSGETLSQVMHVVAQNIAHGEIMAYSSVPAWQKTASDLGVSGEVLPADHDYLYVVSSNVGGTKANYWVTRSTDYSVFVDRNGRLRAKLIISFDHSGTSETWPGGTYKDYLRVLVPEGSTLVESEGFDDTVSVDTKWGKNVIGGLVEVPIQSSKQVVLSYELPERLNVQDTSKYLLLVQQQPGIREEAVNVALGVPFFLSVEQTAPPAEKIGETLSWGLDLQQDTLFEVMFSEPQ